MQYILGIDEAGRGAVVGPLVVSGVLFNNLEFLKNINIKDSKKLSSLKRAYFYDIILDEAEEVFVKIAWPELIDTYVYKHKLNILEAEMMSNIINSLTVVDRIIIDSPQRPGSFIKLLKLNNFKEKVICEFKADCNYLEVAAASIVSKVIRDNIICNLRKEFGDFNSGYPSDIKTRSFIKENFILFSSYIRKSYKLK